MVLGLFAASGACSASHADAEDAGEPPRAAESLSCSPCPFPSLWGSSSLNESPKPLVRGQPDEGMWQQQGRSSEAANLRGCNLPRVSGLPWGQLRGWPGTRHSHAVIPHLCRWPCTIAGSWRGAFPKEPVLCVGLAASQPLRKGKRPGFFNSRAKSLQ